MRLSCPPSALKHEAGINLSQAGEDFPIDFGAVRVIIVVCVYDPPGVEEVLERRRKVASDLVEMSELHVAVRNQLVPAAVLRVAKIGAIERCGLVEAPSLLGDVRQDADEVALAVGG